jgi:pyruvate dehydrogenase E1 component beta subunit
MTFGEAIEDALAQAMAADDRVVVFGEDCPGLRMNLYARFGEMRVRPAPISESAFLGAAVGAAMAGLRPVVEIMLVDFIAVALDALVNQAAKLEAFSGGRWRAPMVVRASCGGGYGDGGQHEQSLWGWLGHIPGLTVVVPSTPTDAGGLLLGALEHDGPVVFLEHKLLSADWLDYLGSGGRTNVSYDIPAAGARGPVPDAWEPTPIGAARICREGADLTLVGVGVAVHRALEAAGQLAADGGIEAAVIDLRTVQPLDRAAVCEAVRSSGRLVVVDEDYRDFGLSGELAATVMEAGIPARFARVCANGTIPFDRRREERALPNVDRILEAANRVLGS